MIELIHEDATLDPTLPPSNGAARAPAGAESPAQLRASSCVTRERRGERVVYIKRYAAEGTWGATEATTRARAGREVELLRRLSESNAFGPRLGRLTVLTADPAQALLVTEEAAGRSLHELLIGPFRKARSREGLQAVFLAGRWLRQFQTLPVLPGDERAVSENDPSDLIEYCDVRMRTLRLMGYRWMTRRRRQKIRDRLASLLAQSACEDRQMVWRHGDYVAGNLLWDGTCLTAIDFGMCGCGPALSDVSYFMHRIEMLPVMFPWHSWPVARWKRAFLRGYGREKAEQSPMYQALAIRHLLCRLQSLVRRPPRHVRQALHNAWVRRWVRANLNRAIGA